MLPRLAIHAFEEGSTQAEVDLGAIVADPGDLKDRTGSGGDDGRAHVERVGSVSAFVSGFLRMAITLTRAA